ncbi:MAG TPA: D-alanine--D-alanine ligase family protein [Clostridia bacterium]|nr:D-alanine--D-alanine ligase family protein [Clostridia bacterium]
MAVRNMAVLYGSRSCEHDVSVVSAVQWMAAADPAKYNVIPVYLAHDGGWYTGASLRKLETYRSFDPARQDLTRVLPDLSANACELIEYAPKAKLFGGGSGRKVVARIDVAVPIFHGLNGEDGSIQGVLELMNVPYTSSGLVGSAVGMDKIAMKQLFMGCGFPVLESVWFCRDAWEKDPKEALDSVEKAFAYPCFVKPANLGSSIGIGKATDRATLQTALEVAFSYDRRVLVEPSVEKPIEVNCSVMGFGSEITPSVCEMPVSWEEFLTFEEKYIAGNQKGAKGGMANLKRQIPAPIDERLTEQIQALSCAIFRALDCKGVVRIDFLLEREGERLFVNEINTIPGSMAFYLWDAMGISYPQLIDRLVALADRAHQEKNRATFAFDSKILQSVQLGVKG